MLAQATETDQAFSISPPGAINVPLNQASETDTAQPITVDPQHRLVSPASETDSAQPITALQSKIVAVGQATEADTAQPVTLETRRLVGQATETDIAQPFTVLKTRSIGQATETDTAQPIIQPVGQVIPVGQAIETDTAQPITWEVRRLVGLASETDFALPITVVGGVADVEQGGGSGGHGAVILPPRPYEDAVPEPPPGVSMDEMLAALVVIDLDQNGYD